MGTNFKIVTTKKKRGKVTGFFRTVSEIMAKKWVVDRAFEAGQKGEPPPVYSDSEAGRHLQQIFNEAYEKGQKSILTKIANKLAE